MGMIVGLVCLSLAIVAVPKFARFAARLLPNRPPRIGPRISKLDDDGLTVAGSNANWSDIQEIVTYKHDFVAYDMVCIALQLQGSKWVEVWEEDPRFGTLTAELRRRFPTIPESWYHDVCLPAFKTNYRVLWNGA